MKLGSETLNGVLKATTNECLNDMNHTFLCKVRTCRDLDLFKTNDLPQNKTIGNDDLS